MSQPYVYPSYPAPQTDNFIIIAGPCILEGEDGELNLQTARKVKAIVDRLGIKEFYFKSSYDKANRTSINSFRGPGLHKGMEILKRIKGEVGVPILTDVHEAAHCAVAAQVCDFLQIPAFLCRQTDLLEAAAQTGKKINIKKGQFLSPGEMKHCANKVREAGNDQIYITERGTTFGYNNLVVDMRSFPQVKELGYPMILDATHSVQQPGGLDGKSGGKRSLAPGLARAAVAAGADGLFFETHPDPETAMSDGPNQIPIEWIEPMLTECLAIREAMLKSILTPA
jgi:2-dehydro-3-deoxyphosphooctonate aldolase (KDO 8-P synthase)